MRASKGMMGVVAALLCGLNANAQESLDKQLALQAGNYWIYSGSVEWAEAGQARRVSKRDIVWKTEILEHIKHGQLQAYLVKGALNDLVAFDPAREPGSELWISYQDRLFMVAAQKICFTDFAIQVTP